MGKPRRGRSRVDEDGREPERDEGERIEDHGGDPQVGGGRRFPDPYLLTPQSPDGLRDNVSRNVAPGG